MTAHRILCVDDEPRVLEALDNHLSMTWEVETATSARAALRILEDRTFAVVVSDMRMPEINGAAFLGQVRERFPNTVRVLLTGQSDLEDAASAVNESGIYRFLLKPCPTERLVRTVAEAVRQHELLVAEQVLLEQTLRGSVEVLTEMLGLAQPRAFGCSNRLAAMVRHVVARLAIPDSWQIELAAMLSQLGCVTLDSALIEGGETGVMTAQQCEAFARHPEAGASFLARIPRLDGVVAMVRAQLLDAPPAGDAVVRLGGELLQLVVQVDRWQRRGNELLAAVARAAAARAWTPALVNALRSFRATTSREARGVTAKDLRPLMVLAADCVSPKGDLWIASGRELTEVAVKRLRTLAHQGLLCEPVLVRVTDP